MFNNYSFNLLKKRFSSSFSSRNKNDKLLIKLETKLLNELKDNLQEQSKNLVFGRGSPTAKVFFIGEAPGKDEDEQGLPFIGKAGKELTNQLNKINLHEKDYYIANILKYRPPKNRDPTKEEIINHTPYLLEQINIIKPKYIITLGNFATKFALSNFSTKGMSKVKGISDLHSKLHKVSLNNIEYKVFPMYHPSAMMYNNKVRKDFENDFKKLKNLL